MKSDSTFKMSRASKVALINHRTKNKGILRRALIQAELMQRVSVRPQRNSGEK